MKKIRIIESELIDLIEKLVKENIGNGTGFNFGMLGTPTSKYKELEETASHGEFNTTSGEEGEEGEEVDEEFNYDTSQTGDKTITVDRMDQTNQTDWMAESITESQLIKRLQGKLITEKKKKKGKKDKTWIQKAYKSGDVKKDKLTDYCDGKVTCKCVEKALKNKGMKKGAQMYLNMNKSKCKSLRD